MNFGPTPLEARQHVRRTIAEATLEGQNIQIQIKNYFSTTEDLIEGKTSIECTLNIKDDGIEYEHQLAGSGHGPIDALFTALAKHFQTKYSSLESFSFVQFGVEADMKSRHRESSGSAAEVEAMMLVSNERGDDTIFRATSSSVVLASIRVVIESIEYFVAIEKAVKKLKIGIDDAKKRNRGDIVSQRISDLIELVGTTCYADIIK